MRRFLKYELDAYLRNRASEAVEELPLERVENQQYIHYNKGSVVMYLLQQRLGEDAVDRALARSSRSSASRARPICVDRPDRRVPQGSETPEQQQLITDLFEKITLYDLKVADAVTQKDATGWTTSLTVDADKYYADGKGERQDSAA